MQQREESQGSLWECSPTCCKTEGCKAQILTISSSNPHLRGIHNSEVHRNNEKDDIDEEFAYWGRFLSAEGWLIKEISQKSEHSKGEGAFHADSG